MTIDLSKNQIIMLDEITAMYLESLHMQQQVLRSEKPSKRIIHSNKERDIQYIIDLVTPLSKKLIEYADDTEHVITSLLSVTPSNN